MMFERKTGLNPEQIGLSLACCRIQQENVFIEASHLAQSSNSHAFRTNSQRYDLELAADIRLSHYDFRPDPSVICELEAADLCCSRRPSWI